MDSIQNVLSFLRYIYYDYWEELADPRTAHYPLISSGPTIVILIIVFYLLFVKQIGPKIMANREPFNLKKLILLYNSTLMLGNAFGFLYLLSKIDYGRIFFNFKFPDHSDTSFNTKVDIFLGYLCYLSRFVDLFDTVFFVLRKKFKQITFLHLYHHSFVPILGWIGLKVAPRAPVIKLFLLINCFIHTIMYLYYTLAIMGTKMQKYLWWKKYITQIQLSQFVICFLYAFIMIFLQEGYPAGVFWIAFAQNPFFFWMFYDFYKQSYNRSRKHEAKKII